MSAEKNFELASVSFAPVYETPPALPGEARFTLPAPVERMESELGPRLLELARQARRLGPVGEGAVLLLAGCATRSGVSSLALALARVASTAYSVVLLDGNPLNADVSRLAAPDNHHDWMDVLLGQCPLAEAQFSLDEEQRLRLLPLLQGNATVADDALRDMVQAARQGCELLIIDGGSVASCRWTKCADAALLVCDPRRTPQKSWAPAWDCLESGGSDVLGVVEIATTFPEYVA